MKNTLTKMQIDRIEDRLREKVDALIAKKRIDSNTDITNAQILKEIKNGSIKLRKVALNPDLICTKYSDLNVCFNDIFDCDKLNSIVLKNKLLLDAYANSLRERRIVIMDKIILSGETLEWALQQLEK